MPRSHGLRRLAIGGALWLGSRNLLMGLTIGGILALMFGGFAVFAVRRAHPCAVARRPMAGL